MHDIEYFSEVFTYSFIFDWASLLFMFGFSSYFSYLCISVAFDSVYVVVVFILDKYEHVLATKYVTKRRQ